MEKPVFKNILLISGSGRNCGKTTLVCNIINQLAEHNVIGLKISPHFHQTNDKQEIISIGEGYKIYREKDTSSGKDSSRMLAAGAETVYFAQCHDDKLPELFETLKKLLPIEIPVVCESGSFVVHYSPGMHILVKETNNSSVKRSYLNNLRVADKIFLSSEISLSNLQYSFSYLKYVWEISQL